MPWRKPVQSQEAYGRIPQYVCLCRRHQIECTLFVVEEEVVVSCQSYYYIYNFDRGESDIFSVPNVGCHLLPLAFGADPASAGSVTKVPKAWELGGQLCSVYFVLFPLSEMSMQTGRTTMAHVSTVMSSEQT